MTTRKKNASFNFEASLKELEEIVASMEKNESDLEKSLSLFERGVNLTKQCQQALQASEQRVQILLEQNAAHSLQTFQDDKLV